LDFKLTQRPRRYCLLKLRQLKQPSFYKSLKIDEWNSAKYILR